MTDRMLRGTRAPTGFAASISAWLRTYVYQQRAGGPTLNALERLDLLDSCSSLPVAVGDDDPRIRAIALASPGNQFVPGPEQTAAIHAAGLRIPGEDAPALKPDALLNALAHAAALDVASAHAQEISRIKKGVEAAPTQEAMLQFERERADTEAAARKELQRENDNLRNEVGAAYRRAEHAEAIVMGGVVTTTPTIAEPRPLPEGVREKGSGYQAYFKVNGKTSSKTLPTVDEAVRWRTAALEAAA